MRALKRKIGKPFHKVEFKPVVTTGNGDAVIRWNTEKRTIAAKVTRPLTIVLLPDAWSERVRRGIPADDWLVDEREQTEEVNMWLN